MTTERTGDIRTGEDIDNASVGSLTDDEQAQAAELRAEIEEAREEMGGTLNELGDRLEPSHLVQQAKENVRDATIGRVEETARGTTDMVMETIKRNPIPAALAGAGLALLWMNRSEGGSYRSSDYRTYRYRDEYDQAGQGIGGKVGEVGSTVGGAVGNVRDGAGEAVSTVAQGANQAADEVGLRIDRFMKASPLAVGAIAVGAGVLAGTIIPDTPQEQELLGDASRQVVNTVRQTVDDVATKAEEALDETEQKVSSSS